MTGGAGANGGDALGALTRFVRMASGADLVVVAQARGVGPAFPVASAPTDVSAPFRLDTMDLQELD